MQLAFFLLAMLIPWVLGFSMIKPFLKQRNGYLSFATGAGYVLGWFVATLILRVYDYFERPFNIYEIVVIECTIVAPLLFLKARALRFDEIQRERPPSKLVWFLLGIMVCLLLYRWGLSAIDLLSKPVLPWDGWFSWSAKAKIFYEYHEIPNLVKGYVPWYLLGENDVVANGARHPYFISLIQTYTATAWGGWNDAVVGLPWLGASVAMANIMFGGVRYLGGRLLPALLVSYAVVSLPVLDVQASLGSYADLWVGLELLICLYLLVMTLAFDEKRLLCFLAVFLIITYLTKNTALVFIFVLLAVWCWRLLGGVLSVGWLILLGGVVYVTKDWLNAEFTTLLPELLSSQVSGNILIYNPVLTKAFHEWGVLDNWHYVFVASLGSLVLFLLYKKKREGESFVLFIVAGLSSLLIMLILTFFTEKMFDIVFVGYFNRVSLFFIPILIVLPVSIYHLIHKNDAVA